MFLCLCVCVRERDEQMCQSRYNRWFGSSGKRLKRKQTRSQSLQAHVSFLLFITCILLPGLHTDSICVFFFRDYSTQLNASRINHLQSQDDIVTDSVAKDLLRVSNNKNAYKKLSRVSSLRYLSIYLYLLSLLT